MSALTSRCMVVATLTAFCLAGSMASCDCKTVDDAADTIYEFEDLSACNVFEEGEAQGEVDSTGLSSIAGLALGRLNDGIFWALSGSEDETQVIGIRDDGSYAARITLDDVDPVSLDGIATGPGPDDSPWIFVGDIGDDGLERDSVMIYGFPEPYLDVYLGTNESELSPDILTIDYPEDPVDGNALMYDPVEEVLIIVAGGSDGATQLLEVTMPSDFETQVTARDVVDFVLASESSEDSVMVTAADISPEGEHVVLRTSTHVLYWPRDQVNMAANMKLEPCLELLADEDEGGSIAMGEEGYYTLSEGDGQPIYYVAFR